MRAAAALALAVGLLGWPSEAPRAQGFGFLFGQPERGYGYRATRRSRARIAAVPMPVPRPHFPEDEPRAPSAAPSESAETTHPNTAPATPTARAGATALEPPPKAGAEPKTPPLPPEKPAALVAPPDGKSSEAERTEAPNSAVDPKPPKAKTPEIKTSDIKTPDVRTPPLPAVAPSGATNAFNPRQPAADATCPDRLQATHVDAAPVSLGPQPDARCVVQQPVKLDHLTLKTGSRISFPDRPTIACATADTFATYVRDLLVPLAKGTYGVSLDSVWTGPGLECRSRDHIFGAKLSAHGQGLAIDVAQLKLGDGRILAVGDPKSDEDQAFETAARAAGCGYFHTVLGPGSDSYHRTHWHFDLEERGSKGDSKFCK